MKRIALLVFLLLCSSVLAGTITVEWRVPTPPHPRIAGWVVAWELHPYGTRFPPDARVLVALDQTKATIDNLTDCKEWDVAVLSRDANGVTSREETAGHVTGWPDPVIYHVAEQGQVSFDEIIYEIQGINFRIDVELRVNGQIVSPSSVECDTIVFRHPGAWTIVVGNPGEVATATFYADLPDVEVSRGGPS